MNAPPIRFVYFDLDDTLLDHRHAERMALADVCETHEEAFAHVSVEAVRETYHRHNVELWRRYREGEIDPPTLRRLRFEQLVEALALDGLEPKALDELYLDCYGRHWTLTDGAEAAFHAVADRLPVGVLTNGFSEVQHRKLARFPELRDRLQALVISDEVGHLKPDPRIFAHATEQAGVPAEHILYVGDSLSSDVRGTLDAGWQIAWYTDDGTEAPAGTFCFHQWDALVDWLEPVAEDRYSPADVSENTAL